MNRQLWIQIVDFDLDHPLSEYGFSTRLAAENQWPVTFTNDAILEYKKFMYLAATSGAMVSPSEIVDIVWHQHLIFTKSYEAFCQLLGKRIEHIPSTHNRAEGDKFELARKFTKEQYTANFGKQPKEFWEYHNLYEPLKLKKSRIGVQTFFWAGSLALIILVILVNPLLREFYSKVNNPWFLLQYILLATMAVMLMRFFNKQMVINHLKKIDKNAFIFNLDPTELIYMRYGKIDDLVHASINQFIQERKIVIQNDFKLSVPKDFECKNAREFVIKDFIQLLIKVYYKVVVNRVRLKAIFQNTKRFADTLRSQFMESTLYMKLMTINFMVYGIILMLGLTRLLTGISRGKPVGLLIFVLLISIVTLAYFLLQVKNVLTRKAIPSFYQLRVKNSPESYNTNEWKYFVHRQAVLSAMLIPLIAYEPVVPGNKSNGDSGSGCGSGGSSCGSSCGSGCGGCGGD